MLSQNEKVYQILRDGHPHSTYEITAKMFNTIDTTKIGMWRLGARIADNIKRGHAIKGFWGEENGKRVYFYQMTHDNQKAIEKLDDPDLDNILKDFVPEFGRANHKEIVRLKAEMDKINDEENPGAKNWYRQKIKELL